MIDYINEQIQHIKKQFILLQNEYENLEAQTVSLYYDYNRFEDETEKMDILQVIDVLEEETVNIIEKMKGLFQEQNKILNDASIFFAISNTLIVENNNGCRFKLDHQTVNVEELLENEEIKQNSNFCKKLEMAMFEADHSFKHAYISGVFNNNDFDCETIKLSDDRLNFVTIDFTNGTVITKKKHNIEKFINNDYNFNYANYIDTR